MSINNKVEKLEWSGNKLEGMSLKELQKLKGVVGKTKDKKEKDFIRLQKKIHFLSLIKSECDNLISLKLEIEEIQKQSKKLIRNVKESINTVS